MGWVRTDAGFAALAAGVALPDRIRQHHCRELLFLSSRSRPGAEGDHLCAGQSGHRAAARLTRAARTVQPGRATRKRTGDRGGRAGALPEPWGAAAAAPHRPRRGLNPPAAQWLALAPP